MERKYLPKNTKNPISLLLVEGETEMLFYGRIKNTFLADYRATIRNIEGLRNINEKVINAIVDYVEKHKDEKIRVYCCLDRESRYGQIPEFDIRTITKYVKNEDIRTVLSIELIEATQQIESWFFYDVDGILKFLRVPKNRIRPQAFKPPEKFGYKNLQKLFERYGKAYTKGKKAENFINHLDIQKIASNCEELRNGINLIQSQAGDLTNHLFPAKKKTLRQRD